MRFVWLKKRDDEYASADEFFSSDEDLFSIDDSAMTECVKEGVNFIVPCFGTPTHFEVEYHSKPAITPLVISLPGPVPYKSDKAVPYKYNATILEDGVEVPIQPIPNIGNIVETSRVTRNGRVFALVVHGDVSTGKKIVEDVEPKKAVGESSGATL